MRLPSPAPRTARAVITNSPSDSIVEYIEHKGVKVQDLLEDAVLDWAEMQAEDDMLDPDGDDYDPIDAELGGNYGGTD